MLTFDAVIIIVLVIVVIIITIVFVLNKRIDENKKIQLKIKKLLSEDNENLKETFKDLKKESYIEQSVDRREQVNKEETSQNIISSKKENDTEEIITIPYYNIKASNYMDFANSFPRNYKNMNNRFPPYLYKNIPNAYNYVFNNTPESIANI